MSYSNRLPKHVIEESESILDEFSLCDSCLGRLYSKQLKLSSNKRLGKKIRLLTGHKKDQKCFICKDLVDHLDNYVDEILSVSQNSSFSSFLIGAILKPSVLDRDDLVRSKFHRRGIVGIKSEITQTLTKLFSRKSQKAVNYENPDATFVVNFRTGICEQKNRPVFLSGRYTKSKRGLAQRQKPCSDCKGKGCIFCNNRGISGFDSVEGKISQFLYGQFGCTQVKFTWLGGEDKNSIVAGDGRKFFAKLINPKKRNKRLRQGGGAVIPLEEIHLSNLKKIPRIPEEPPRFQSQVLLQIESKLPVKQNLSCLRRLRNSQIMVREDSRTHIRKIHEVHYRSVSPTLFCLTIVVDGGVPVKKFVEGGTHPSVSEVLGVPCKCNTFDFEQIRYL